MKKTIGKYIFALTLASLFHCGDTAFCQQVAEEIFKSYANGSYFTLEGGFYGNVGASLGTDNMYTRRGQETSGDTTSQILSLIEADQNATSSNYTQSISSNNRKFWATPYYSTYSGRTGYDDEITPGISGGSNYNMRRTGFLGGVSSINQYDLNAGWLIGYSKVGMSQIVDIIPWEPYDVNDNPYGVVDYTGGVKISIADFQFGGEIKYRFSNGFYLIGTVVGGAQDYRWQRRMYESFGDGRNPLEGLYNLGTTGNTLVANLKLKKTYDLNEYWSITPSADVESSNSWIFKSTETGLDYYFEADGAAGTCWLPWRMVDDLLYNRVTTRIGADLGYADENMGFQVGAFYGTQLAGNDSAKIEICDATAPDAPLNTIYGNGFGRDTLDCEANLWAYLNAMKTARISGLYSIRLYSKATSQVVGGTYTVDF